MAEPNCSLLGLRPNLVWSEFIILLGVRNIDYSYSLCILGLLLNQVRYSPPPPRLSWPNASWNLVWNLNWLCTIGPDEARQKLKIIESTRYLGNPLSNVPVTLLVCFFSVFPSGTSVPAFLTPINFVVLKYSRFNDTNNWMAYSWRTDYNF